MKEWLGRWQRRVRTWRRRSDLGREMEEEMRFHVELEAEDLARFEGLDARTARRRAQLAFGGMERFREEGRSARGIRPLDDLITDIRYGLRWLRRTPGFAAVAMLTLALGIGVTTALFSVVSALLLRPLPYAEAERIVFLGEGAKTTPGEASNTSFLNFSDWQAQSTSYESMALFNDWFPAFTGHGAPERLAGALVTAGLFDVFRIRPQLGRPMLAADNRPDSEPVVVLSHDFWRSRLAADPAVIGKTILLNGRPRTVIAVLPQGFHAPAELDADVWGNNYFDESDTRGSRYLRAMARLKPGVSVTHAGVELAEISARLEQEYPGTNRGLTARVVPLRDTLVGEVRLPVLALFGAACFVLLIVCANLVNLLLARSSARERELSIRVAIGADRFRMVRQLLTESAVLVTLGGLGAVLLAWLATDLIQRFAPPAISARDISLDVAVLGFTCLVALLVTLLVGLLPALRGSAVHPQAALKEGARGSTEGPRRSYTRSALVCTQLGLALALLIGTGLLLRSLVRLNQVDPGIRAESMLAASMNLPSAKYPDGTEPAFFNELLGRVAALPGMRSAAVTSILPFGGSWDRVALDVEGLPVTAGVDKPEADRYIVSPGYFETMGIELRAGRLPSERDAHDHPLVAVVDEVFARRIARNGSALGVRLHLPGRDSLATVVGVVSHVKHYGLDRSSNGQVYMSHLQYPWRWMNLVARASVEPLTLAPAVRDAVWQIDSDQPVFGFTTMEALMAERGAVRHFVVLLLGAFAALALLVAVVGLYGVIAYGVAQRRLEIGIRLALGARPQQVVTMVLGNALPLALAGALLGLAGAMAGARLLQGLLFGVAPGDPLVIGTVTTLLIAVALMASYVPARRAARTDPMRALREQ